MREFKKRLFSCTETGQHDLVLGVPPRDPETHALMPADPFICTFMCGYRWLDEADTKEAWFITQITGIDPATGEAPVDGNGRITVKPHPAFGVTIFECDSVQRPPKGQAVYEEGGSKTTELPYERKVVSGGATGEQLATLDELMQDVFGGDIAAREKWQQDAGLPSGIRGFHTWNHETVGKAIHLLYLRTKSVGATAPVEVQPDAPATPPDGWPDVTKESMPKDEMLALTEERIAIVFPGDSAAAEFGAFLGSSGIDEKPTLDEYNKAELATILNALSKWVAGPH